MDKETIIELINATPFVAFEIETVGGKRIRITHPDYLVFSPDQKYLAVWGGHSFNVLAPHQIASVNITPEEARQTA